MTASDIAYDIIPDIHGDLCRLQITLEALGYGRRAGVWRAPRGRKAAFLGDFIDAGADNAGVIDAVRAMVRAEEAVAIMGNHELNAWLFHTPGKNLLDHPCGYMRAHNARNLQQHATFLKEFPVGSAAAADAISFFSTLPVFLDLGGLRLAHASWSESRVCEIRARRPDGRLHADDLQAIGLEDVSDPFVDAVLSMVKGPEAPLPDSGTFIDHKGDPRGNIRLSWWTPEARTWRDVAASVPDPSELPDGLFDPSLVPTIDPGRVPVAFGHYKRRGAVSIDAPRALCLDYPDHAIAYRWDGEAAFDLDKIVLAA